MCLTPGFRTDNKGARRSPVGIEMRQARAPLGSVHAHAARSHELWSEEALQGWGLIRQLEARAAVPNLLDKGVVHDSGGEERKRDRGTRRL